MRWLEKYVNLWMFLEISIWMSQFCPVSTAKPSQPFLLEGTIASLQKEYEDS